jgi:mannitol/fructose-specific phosphotransferase system IIA component (Ntr-type)
MEAIMIDLAAYIYPDLILNDLRASSKEEAIATLLDALYRSHPECTDGVTRQEALSAVMSREKAQTTGLGEGLAFPHARIKGWQKFAVILGYVREGVDFKSLDGAPAYFVCLMISSEDEPYMVLKSMSSLIKFVNGLKDIGSLFNDNGPERIASVFKNERIATNKIIEAQDIMRPVEAVVREDDPIDRVIQVMHIEKIDVLPVVDDEGKLKGQISCFNIFEGEIPDFFKQLHTVSFVRNIDPFEKFFVLQKDLKVKDFLKEECATVDYRDTLLEIIFQLTTKTHPRLFVLEDEKLAGVIDRFSVLDRVLFF